MARRLACASVVKALLRWTRITFRKTRITHATDTNPTIQIQNLKRRERIATADGGGTGASGGGCGSVVMRLRRGSRLREDLRPIQKNILS
jgi:hypothetical protein